MGMLYLYGLGVPEVLVYLAAWVSCNYMLIIYKQTKCENKPCKIDYSLSSPYMRKAINKESFAR